MSILTERYNMKTTHLIDKTVDPMIRIADAIEEILQLVKADQERSKKYMEDRKDD